MFSYHLPHIWSHNRIFLNIYSKVFAMNYGKYHISIFYVDCPNLHFQNKLVLYALPPIMVKDHNLLVQENHVIRKAMVITTEVAIWVTWFEILKCKSVKIALTLCFQRFSSIQYPKFKSTWFWESPWKSVFMSCFLMHLSPPPSTPKCGPKTSNRRVN